MVPEGWEKAELGKIAKITSGGTPSRGKPEYWSGGIPWVSTGEIKNKRIFSSSETISEEGLANSAAKLFPKNTILVALYGQGKTRGEVAMLKVQASTNQACGALLPSTAYDSEFLFQLLDSKYKTLRNLSNEGAQKNLSGALLKSFHILLPPLAEQKKIAEILSTWDRAIEVAESQLENTKAQKKALMQQLLTGKRRLPGFDGEWRTVKLGDLADPLRKNSFIDGDWIERPHISSSGIRLIQTGNIGVGYFKAKNKKYIFEKSFEELKCKEVCHGDILICRLADPAGRSCIIPCLNEVKMMTSVDITIFRPDPLFVEKRFLVELLNTPQILFAMAKRCGGSTRTRIARSELGKLPITIPSVNEQREIATVAASLNQSISSRRTALLKLRTEKRALMQQLLTGKKRVKV